MVLHEARGFCGQGLDALHLESWTEKGSGSCWSSQIFQPHSVQGLQVVQ